MRRRQSPRNTACPLCGHRADAHTGAPVVDAEGAVQGTCTTCAAEGQRPACGITRGDLQTRDARS